jgi:DNA-binding XRE family transcriptional regulator
MAMIVHKLTLDGRKYAMIPLKEWESFFLRSTNEHNQLINVPQSLRDGNCDIDQVRKSLASKIIAARKEARITQEQLSKLSGVRVETISRLENGLHMPSAHTFARLGKALKTFEKK